MQAFDASSIIYAWDNYPIHQFPPLWRWMASQVESNEIVMSRVAFDEVADKAPDCAKWLKDNEIEFLEVSNEIVQEAVRIKGMLDIDNDNYHAKGVGENDLLIIATAKVHGIELVSDENKQTILPDTPKKKKIPAVCQMNDVAIPCASFIEYIKDSGQVFG